MLAILAALTDEGFVTHVRFELGVLLAGQVTALIALLANPLRSVRVTCRAVVHRLSQLLVSE